MYMDRREAAASRRPVKATAVVQVRKDEVALWKEGWEMETEGE